MAVKVLDSWALMAFFLDEPAAKAVEELLVAAEEGSERLLLSVVNWGEVYYSTMRSISQEAAEVVVREMAGYQIQVIGVDDKDRRLVRQAAVYKATRRMSYADAFAAALARIWDAQLVTGDKEFKVVEDEIKIGWLK